VPCDCLKVGLDFVSTDFKPNSITLASSELAPNMFGASEKGMGVPTIIGDVIGGRVRRRWRVPIRIDSYFVLLRARPL